MTVVESATPKGDVMAKLMWIAGIVLVAVAVALGLMIVVSTASVVGWGLDFGVVAVLLIGGILSVGLGGVIDALAARDAAVAASLPPYMQPVAPDTRQPIPEFGRRSGEAAPAATVAAAIAADEVSPEVKKTIDALEQAKQDLTQAFDTPAAAEAPDEDPSAATVATVEATVVDVELAEEAAPEEAVPEEAEPVEEEILEEGQLYVVEERTIRNRPARILSDGTVEAETDEGWMRFENLEHLDEYLEAMSPSTRA